MVSALGTPKMSAWLDGVPDAFQSQDLRNHGGNVVDRVVAGESMTVTRDGKPVAELRPLGRPVLPAGTLLRRWAQLPVVDPCYVREDIDLLIDPSL